MPEQICIFVKKTHQYPLINLKSHKCATYWSEPYLQLGDARRSAKDKWIFRCFSQSCGQLPKSNVGAKVSLSCLHSDSSRDYRIGIVDVLTSLAAWISRQNRRNLCEKLRSSNSPNVLRNSPLIINVHWPLFNSTQSGVAQRLAAAAAVRLLLIISIINFLSRRDVRLRLTRICISGWFQASGAQALKLPSTIDHSAPASFAWRAAKLIALSGTNITKMRIAATQ